jgi:ankyrin repeat protein
MNRITHTLSSVGDRLLAPFLLAAFLSIPAAYYLCHSRPENADPSLRAAAETRQLARLDAAPLADLNAPDPSGTTPLMAAARVGDSDAVNHLLARGVDVNTYDPTVGTALICAAHAGRAPIVLALLRRGADPTPFTSTGTDALWCAVLSGDTPTITALLHTNAVDPNSPRRRHPLLSGVTATGDRPDLVRLLLSAGCDPTLPDPDDRLPLPLSYLHENAPNSAQTLLSLTPGPLPQSPPIANALTPPNPPR